MDITPESRIGEIASHHPLATRVFARHGIDFCCGGGAPLSRACETKGLAVGDVLDEIHQVLDGPHGAETDWLTAPLSDLVDHIVTTFHVPLSAELPRLETMARKVAQVHAERDPEGRLPAIVTTFVGLRGELEDHMAREEEILFPALLQGVDGLPFQVFVDDHSEAGEALERLRSLTEGYVAPADACNTWRALWAGLADLETSLHEHIHLENNVLFPRAQAASELAR